ncbi:MAG: hypothetical protein AAF438_06775 [Pseudomonadota bacterium]
MFTVFDRISAFRAGVAWPARIGYLVLFVCAFALTGCASGGNEQLNNVIYRGAMTMNTLAEVVLDECANEPGGPCVEGSRITTDEKDRIGRMVESYLRLSEEAHELKKSGEQLVSDYRWLANKVGSEDEADQTRAEAERALQEAQQRVARMSLMVSNIHTILVARGILE